MPRTTIIDRPKTALLQLETAAAGAPYGFDYTEAGTAADPAGGPMFSSVLQRTSGTRSQGVLGKVDGRTKLIGGLCLLALAGAAIGAVAFQPHARTATATAAHRTSASPAAPTTSASAPAPVAAQPTVEPVPAAPMERATPSPRPLTQPLTHRASAVTPAPVHRVAPVESARIAPPVQAAPDPVVSAAPPPLVSTPAPEAAPVIAPQTSADAPAPVVQPQPAPQPQAQAGPQGLSL